ncbi:hypothetical protein AHF37_02614 [Paragonimus kellicotti]|nr:hypothetical protein AHF37_02614 [Paragonimus kellicotti]
METNSPLNTFATPPFCNFPTTWSIWII